MSAKGSNFSRLTMIPGVDVLVARIADCSHALLPQEQGEVERAVKKRRLEFAAGRNLARVALADLGYRPCAIPRADRLPVWPAGIVGSITHSTDLVAVCVGTGRHLAGVGIDIESASRVTHALESKILTSEEIADTSVPDARTLRFACKEAVYKAVNPIVGEFFGFQSVRIEIDAASGTFEAIPVKDGAFADHVCRGRGVFVEWQGHHLAGFWVAR